ncbi:hypothetical protein [Mycolicibacterium pulveris]|uniref:hypothetical protein n=1 Tax=Mycolicibacterium pulveris TaxID=36813 RepID=UPI003CF875FC
MKLARPDVFHPRIVLAGSPALPDGDRDDAGLIGALRKHGLHARWLAWDDPATLKADLVILRAAGADEEFLAWTRRVRHLLNPPGAIAWNAGTDYLQDLADAGVATAARGTEELALVFLAGTQSHAFTHSGQAEPDFEVWDVATAALAAAAERLRMAPAELLYARVDLTEESRVRRLDLVAPTLGWTRLDPSTRARQQRVFVLAVESALQRLGLGPLSHRRP